MFLPLLSHTPTRHGITHRQLLIDVSETTFHCLFHCRAPRFRISMFRQCFEVWEELLEKPVDFAQKKQRRDRLIDKNWFYFIRRELSCRAHARNRFNLHFRLNHLVHFILNTFKLWSKQTNKRVMAREERLISVWPAKWSIAVRCPLIVRSFITVCRTTIKHEQLMTGWCFGFFVAKSNNWHCREHDNVV